jgi:uncharacterized protein YmfQ (DUF2313 family)
MADLPSPGRTPLGIYQLRPSQPVWPDFPAQGDALADPSVNDLAQVLYGLLPSGAAWRSPDGAAFEEGTRLGRFWRALAGDFATLYRRLFRISEESTASTLVDSLDDWEAEFGLPDPCFGDSQSRAQRIRALLLKIRSKGTLTKGDFIDLAASAGYEITITEPLPFAFGFSQTGGGEGTGAAIRYFWFVKVRGVGSRKFEFGTSQTGIHSLLDIARVNDLECLFRAIAPAWTRVVFDYS